ncbi:outer membrane protein [Helicobacter felis]|uniref:outer membrane protein n=2 Tax=Helicobacter felis TaxID=214 RepID=UPI000CF070E2|nr:outer membrane protein [Helicobacter felis]
MFGKQQTANATRLLSKTLLASTLSFFTLAPLSAEDNGAFVEGGFEYSNFSSVSTNVVNYSSNSSTHIPTYYNNNIITYNGNLYGINIQVGYKQFFGQKKHFGLRYYGIASLQIGRDSPIYANFTSSVRGINSANVFGGVGIDALFNFYERNKRTFGGFAGVAIGASSWWNHTSYHSGKAEQINQDGGKATFSPTFVQFIVNVGLRTNFTKHQGFEFGVRVPTIDDPYFTIYDDKTTGLSLSGSSLTYRRNVSLYWNYVYNF